MDKWKSLKGRIFSWDFLDFILLVVFIFVLFVFCNRFLFDKSSQDFNLVGMLEDAKTNLNSHLFSYLRSSLSEDTYPSPAVVNQPFCPKKYASDLPLLPKITAILTFSEQEFYGVKRILEGILRALVRKFKYKDKAWIKDGVKGEADIFGEDEFEYGERFLQDVDGDNVRSKVGNRNNPDDIINAWRYVTENDFNKKSDDVGDIFDVICVVDDATSLRHLVEEYKSYFDKFQKLLQRLADFAKKSRKTIKMPQFIFTRHDGPENLGLPGARTFALQTLSPSRYGILVFFDSSSAYNKFWLSPLIKHVFKNSNIVAQPQLDKLRLPVHAHGQVLGWSEKSEEGILNTFTWAFTERPIWAEGWSPNGENSTKTGKKNIPRHFSTPLLRGSTFVVGESFFREIGGYENKKLVAFGGGHHIDLSLKIWMNCGRIDILPCSRVAVENQNDGEAMRDVNNVKYIANKWFNPQQREVVLRQFQITNNNNNNDYIYKNEDSDAVDVYKNCERNFDWFRKNIAHNLFDLDSKTVKFGGLRVQTNRCARLLRNSNKIKLDECLADPAYRLNSTEFFELTSDGQIKVEGRCLFTNPNAFVLAEKCRPNDNTQQWLVRDEELVNVWSNFCAMHVTDPDPDAEGDRQIMMVQDCNINAKDAPFKKWNFIVL